MASSICDLLQRERERDEEVGFSYSGFVDKGELIFISNNNRAKEKSGGVYDLTGHTFKIMYLF